MTGPTTTENARERTVMARPAEAADAYRLDPAQVAASLDVDPATGLSTVQADRRLAAHGPNRPGARSG